MRAEGRRLDLTRADLVLFREGKRRDVVELADRRGVAEAAGLELALIEGRRAEKIGNLAAIGGAIARALFFRRPCLDLRAQNGALHTRVHRHLLHMSY